MKPETVTEENVAPTAESPKDEAPAVEAAPKAEAPKEESPASRGFKRRTRNQKALQKKNNFFFNVHYSLR